MQIYTTDKSQERINIDLMNDFIVNAYKKEVYIMRICGINNYLSYIYKELMRTAIRVLIVVFVFFSELSIF